MKKIKEFKSDIFLYMPKCIAFICAVVMLCIVPLYFDDAFFNINRCKVNLIRTVMPFISAGMLIAYGINIKRTRDISPYASDITMGLFLAACFLSCIKAGFSEVVLEGTQGRSFGLWLILCCGAAYYVISLGKISGKWLTLFMLICAGICAALGILNGAGIDPLNFYDGIKHGQEGTFLSTIGHFDFFGTYLVMMFGLISGTYVFGKKKIVRVFSAIGVVALALGMAVSRTDSAVLGMNLVCMAILSQSGDDYMKMARASSLWALCFAVIPIASTIAEISPYKPPFTGLPLMLCQTYAAHILAAGFMLLAGVFLILKKKDYPAPEKRKLMKIAFSLAVAALMIFVLIIIWFTTIDKNRDLGSASTFLRFDDMWGSARGFVYKRSLRAFSDFSWSEKLFGRGLGTTLSTLRPYFDNPEAINLAGGEFNDSHCYVLQLLLTCGITGTLAFIAFYASMIKVTLKYMKDDAILNGVFAMLIGYFVIMMFNVFQPILISTYFSVCGLAISRIRYLTQKERVSI